MNKKLLLIVRSWKASFLNKYYVNYLKKFLTLTRQLMALFYYHMSFPFMDTMASLSLANTPLDRSYHKHY